MVDRVPYQGAHRRNVEYHAWRATMNDGAEDIPSRVLDGWKIGTRHYASDTTRRTKDGFPAPNDYLVTRPDGYVPYQSVVQPDGRYAYDPNRVQYAQRAVDEIREGYRVYDHATQQFEFMMNRSDNFVHQPGEVVTMGINYDQMRTAVVLPPQQPMLDQYGRPVLPSGSMVAQGPSGAPLDARYATGGYGGQYNGWRLFVGCHNRLSVTTEVHQLEYPMKVSL